MKYWSVIIVLLVFSCSIDIFCQIEHTPITHPVYQFLLRAEAAGYLNKISLASLPLQRKEVVSSLQKIRSHQSELSQSEIETLVRFEKEFLLLPRENAILFTELHDSSFFWPQKVFSNAEKLLYFYRDSTTLVQVYPLGHLEYASKKTPRNNSSIFLAIGGLRAFGTIDNHLGFYLQMTNGRTYSGDRESAIELVPRLGQSTKFAHMQSDFDLTESHVRYDNDWFYAILGRESRLIGSGYFTHPFTATFAPPYDALSAGTKFESFEYRFTHAQLLSTPDSSSEFGAGTNIPPKYMATHRFAFRRDWGEIGLWENVVYSRRNIDLAYLNPLTFIKSVEHSLHDRDNTVLGLDLTARPFDGFQLRGSFLLDDIIIGEIGKDFWGNKSAFNIGAMFSSLPNTDLITEYARVNPFTYSHFSVHNSMTNDAVLLAGDLPLNSDRTTLQLRYWWGNRYPISLTANYLRQGKNIYSTDSTGKIILEKNVGSDPLQTLRIGTDEVRVPFLSGEKKNIFSLSLSAGYEVFRGLHFQLFYQLANDGLGTTHTSSLSFRYEDF